MHVDESKVERRRKQVRVAVARFKLREAEGKRLVKENLAIAKENEELQDKLACLEQEAEALGVHQLDTSLLEELCENASMRSLRTVLSFWRRRGCICHFPRFGSSQPWGG